MSCRRIIRLGGQDELGNGNAESESRVTGGVADNAQGDGSYRREQGSARRGAGVWARQASLRYGRVQFLSNNQRMRVTRM